MLYLLLGLILWSVCNVLICLFSQPLFESLFYLIWVLQLLLSFGLRLHEIFFSSPLLLVCMCPLFWSGFLVDSIYRGLVFVSIQPVFVFWLGHSREVGGGIGMGNTCKPIAVSFQCMTKSTTIKKIIIIKKKNFKYINDPNIFNWASLEAQQ